MLKEYNIAEKLFCITTDGAKTMAQCVKKLAVD